MYDHSYIYVCMYDHIYIYMQSHNHIYICMIIYIYNHIVIYIYVWENIFKPYHVNIEPLDHLLHMDFINMGAKKSIV